MGFHLLHLKLSVGPGPYRVNARRQKSGPLLRLRDHEVLRVDRLVVSELAGVYVPNLHRSAASGLLEPDGPMRRNRDSVQRLEVGEGFFRSEERRVGKECGSR